MGKIPSTVGAMLLLATVSLTGCGHSPEPAVAPPTAPATPPNARVADANLSPAPPTPADADAPAVTDKTPQPKPRPGPREVYPDVWLDRAAGHVEVRAQVIAQRFDWLELLICTNGIREHESILRTDADAAQVHLALLLLGLEPGRPAWAEVVDGKNIFHPPQGPELELLVYADDQPHRLTPANEWIVDQDTGRVMPGNRWLYLGSTFIEHRGQSFFMAQENGTLVSLVNFGDELIGRPTRRSEAGGNDLWTARTDEIPPPGTAVTLRIVPVDPAVAE
jgi:hypothetical protein